MSEQGVSFTPQPQSAFLNIPPEIRNHIYKLLLSVQPTAHLGDVRCVSITPPPPRKRNASSRPTVLELLLTCRQVLHEAEGIFYAIHHLEYGVGVEANPKGIKRYRDDRSKGDPFLHFLSIIGHRRLRAIEGLTVTARTVLDAAQDVQMLRHCYNLRVLHIRLPPLVIMNDQRLIEIATAMKSVLIRLKKLKEVRMIMHPAPPKPLPFEGRAARELGLRRLRLMDAILQESFTMQRPDSGS